MDRRTALATGLSGIAEFAALNKASLAHNLNLVLPAVDMVRGKPAPITEALEPDELGYPERVSLAKRLREWTLPNGTKMSSVCPEIISASNVYLINDLSRYIPKGVGRIKVLYVNDEAVGRFSVAGEFDKDNPLKIVSRGGGVETYESPLIRSLTGTLILPKGMSGTYAELAVAAKEASQVVEYLAYCRLFKRLLEGVGSRFESNDSSVSIDPDIMAVSIAHAQDSYSQDKGIKSDFANLVDIGSHLRVGGILWTNWYLNYQYEQKLVHRNFFGVGEEYAGFLQHPDSGRLIEEKLSTARWRFGKTPALDSREFLHAYGVYVYNNPNIRLG